MTGVVLHLGLHRTGMRAVQDMFFAHRAELAKAGVIYPDLGPNQAHHILAAPWITLPGLSDGYFGADGPEGPWQLLRSARRADAGCLLLSAEAFSRASPARVDMADLASRLSDFGPVRVVVTLRPQTALLPALWLELARHQAPPVLAPFVAKALETHAAAGVWLDYNRLYDHLLHGFAPGQITLLDHHQVATPARLAAALLDMASPGQGQIISQTLRLPHDQPEALPLATYAAARISAPDLVNPDMALRLAPSLGQDDTRLLTRTEYRAIIAAFAPLNTAFEARIQAVQPGFRLTTDPDPTAQTLWRDDLTPAVWARIATTLAQTATTQGDQPPGSPPAGFPRRIWRRILDICLG